MRQRIILSVFVLLAIFISASSFSRPKESSLAKLMGKMMVYIKTEEQNVANNLPMQKYPRAFKKLPTAKESANKTLSKEHQEYAAKFMADLDAYYQTTGGDARKLAFNNMVYSCIKCHQEECPGPVSSIRTHLLK
ncbi:MAG: hypothetical protein U0T75_11515 [Chitinophagales bacterium]